MSVLYTYFNHDKKVNKNTTLEKYYVILVRGKKSKGLIMDSIKVRQREIKVILMKALHFILSQPREQSI